MRHVREMVVKTGALYSVRGHVTTPTATRGFELCCSALQLGRFVPENLHRLIELLNLQWLVQNRDRTDLKNPIEDLAIPGNL